MTDYLRQKWIHLRIMKVRSMYEINYRILRNTAKLMGARNERTRA